MQKLFSTIEVIIWSLFSWDYQLNIHLACSGVWQLNSVTCKNEAGREFTISWIRPQGCNPHQIFTMVKYKIDHISKTKNRTKKKLMNSKIRIRTLRIFLFFVAEWTQNFPFLKKYISKTKKIKNKKKLKK